MIPGRYRLPIWKNPIIVKEVRTRMRGYRSVLLLTAHLVVLALVVGLVYLFIRSSLTTIGNLEERRSFGKVAFGLIVLMELVMISFVAPALSSGAISVEREHQTFDLLRVTLLPARSLVWGKYISGLIFIFLLLFTSLPLQGPAFLIGGVQVQEILLATLMLAVTAAGFCALGMLLSSLIPRTLVSATLAYAVTIFLVFGIPIIAMMIGTLFGPLLTDNLPTQVSPQTQALLIAIGWVVISSTPMASMIGTEVILLDQHNLFLAQIPLSNGAKMLLPSPWLPYVTFYLLFSLAAIWLSIQLVKRKES
jgi:ABC-type transport system involved in multi-copper enzyme maturation permease subunit